MATYQIINLETGDFRTVSLEEAAEIASLDPHEIEWAIEQDGICETENFQITKLREPPDEEQAGDANSKVALPVFVYISQEEFEAHLAESPAAVIRLKWDEPIVREAVEADLRAISMRLRGDDSDVGDGDDLPEPAAVYHLTREMIALIRGA